MKEFLDNIKSKDPAARSYIQIILFYPGVHALFLHRISHFLFKYKVPLLPYLVAYISRALTSVEIHPAVRIGKNLFIDHGVGLVVGETAVIGDNVTLYHGVTLGGYNYEPIKRHPTLGNNVLIGAGAKILGNIKIGDNVKVGAGSVVINDLAEEKTVVAETAKEIERFRKHNIEYMI
ncbi:MAG: serine O-acetyltransferase [Rickettsiales bacterium]|jgi:serine O-acetyltransferase|nr:serine O-acetyltransferase [Rickettsiales bacterium]